MVTQEIITQALDLPNIINGKIKTSLVSQSITNYRNQEYATIYSASDSDLRVIKRSLSSIHSEIKKIPLSKIICLIKQSACFYFKNSEDIIHLANVTGSPISFLNKSINTRKNWCRKIDKFVELCFGHADYDAIPIFIEGKVIGYKKYSSPGPVITLLPSNSDEESLYIIVQALLAKTPCLIRSSTKLCSSFSSLKYIEALNDAIDEMQDPTLNSLRDSINIINLFDVPTDTNIMEKLAVKNASYIIFGSNQTIEKVTSELKEFSPRKIIKMGTGFCASFILENSDLDLAVNEVCESTCINNGNECISTSIVYIEENIYPQALEKIINFAKATKFCDPLDENAYMGSLSTSSRNEISIYLQQKFFHKAISASEIQGMVIVELSDTQDSFDEMPGPVLFIKKIEKQQDGIKSLKFVLAENNILLNLSVSIFAHNVDTFYSLADELPSYNCKFNKGTHHMNMFLAHQGSYLLQELLEFKLIEI